MSSSYCIESSLKNGESNIITFLLKTLQWLIVTLSVKLKISRLVSPALCNLPPASLIRSIGHGSLFPLVCSFSGFLTFPQVGQPLSVSRPSLIHYCLHLEYVPFPPSQPSLTLQILASALHPSEVLHTRPFTALLTVGMKSPCIWLSRQYIIDCKTWVL